MRSVKENSGSQNQLNYFGSKKKKKKKARGRHLEWEVSAAMVKAS